MCNVAEAKSKYALKVAIASRCQTQNVHQNRTQQPITMHHCGLQQVTTRKKKHSLHSALLGLFAAES